MRFVKFLQGIGDRLGILETVSSPDAAPPKRIQMRIVTLQELEVEIKSGEVRALADSPAELVIPFDKIFEAAGVSTNPDDWTIDRLKNLVSSETLKNRSREEVQKAVLDLLSSNGVSSENIVKDAIARDRALDSFEICVREKMRERMEACKKRMQEIESQIGNLQQESAGLQDKLKADEEKWREWRKSKRTLERELASIASYVVDHPVITTDDEDV